MEINFKIMSEHKIIKTINIFTFGVWLSILTFVFIAMLEKQLC